jgi:hypothetical protein
MRFFLVLMVICLAVWLAYAAGLFDSLLAGSR